jgi:hypothetical protein
VHATIFMIFTVENNATPGESKLGHVSTILFVVVVLGAVEEVQVREPRDDAGPSCVVQVAAQHLLHWMRMHQAKHRLTTLS